MLELKTGYEWLAYCKSGKKPPDIATRGREYRAFEEARIFVHKLGLKTGDEWAAYCKSGKKPPDISSNPNATYKNQWKGMGDWLGTGRIADKDKIFRPFHWAREFVRRLGLKSNKEWTVYSKSKSI